MIYDCGTDAGRDEGLLAASAVLRRAELVVMPTDTVYGVAADAFTPAGVAALLAAKGRGRDMPVPVLVGSTDALGGVAAGLSPSARELVDAFWPGPLTLVVRHTPHLAWDLGETRGTVAVRMPQHPVALALLERTGPLAVSSANRSGRPPATTVTEAEAMLGETVSVYLDAGPTVDAVPSTIVDLTGDAPRVLRAGALPVERLRAVLPAVEVADG